MKKEKKRKKRERTRRRCRSNRGSARQWKLTEMGSLATTICERERRREVSDHPPAPCAITGGNPKRGACAYAGDDDECGSLAEDQVVRRLYQDLGLGLEVLASAACERGGVGNQDGSDGVESGDQLCRRCVAVVAVAGSIEGLSIALGKKGGGGGGGAANQSPGQTDENGAPGAPG